MFDHSAVINALRGLDAAAFKAALGEGALADPEIARLVLRDLRHAGCLVVRFENKTAESKRDNLISLLIKEFSQCHDSLINVEFDAHLKDASIAERCYREISSFMKQSDIWKHEPDIQAWATLQSASQKSSDLTSALNQAVTNSNSNQNPSTLCDPTQTKLETSTGLQVNPESAEAALVDSTSSTLQILGHINKWFDQNTEELILPAKVSVSDQIVSESTIHTILSLQWNRIERSWDRSRFFNKHLSSRTQNSRGIELEIISGEDPGQPELIDRISIIRLTRVAYEWFMAHRGHSKPRTPRSLIDDGPRINTEDFISINEHIAVGIMKDVYCLPVDDSSQLFGGISLRTWVRGYAFFEILAYSDDGYQLSGVETICLDYLSASLQKWESRRMRQRDSSNRQRYRRTRRTYTIPH